MKRSISIPFTPGGFEQLRVIKDYRAVIGESCPVIEHPADLALGAVRADIRPILWAPFCVSTGSIYVSVTPSGQKFALLHPEHGENRVQLR